MSREVDVRTFETSLATTQRQGQLADAATAVSELLPGQHRVTVEQVDPTTGNAESIRSSDAPAITGDFVQRALDHVQSVAPALGLTAQGREFTADPRPLSTSTGATAVHLRQTYKGIPIFQATQTVRFDVNGGISDTVGSTVDVTGDPAVSAGLTVVQAVRAAAEHVARPDGD